VPGFKEFEVAPSQAHFGESIRRYKVLVGIALPLAPSFLRGICSIPSFGNREIRRQRLPLDTSKNTSKMIGCSGRFRELLLMFSNAPPKFS
jgi:hypothetical protein